MILTCPQCETRYQADASKFPPAGRNVRCAKCGNVWHQLGPVPEPDPDAELVAHETRAAAPSAAAPVPEAMVERARVADFAPQALADPTIASEASSAPGAAASSWLGRAGLAGGWVALVALVLMIGAAAVTFRDMIATWLPQASSFYAAAGLPVNPRGIDFADVRQALQTEDGQQVLAVTGRIVNRSDHELTVPLVRVALFDGDRHELYHWTFVPGVSTLKPGQSSKFRTRLSSPPSATRDLEVRFARAGE